MPLFWGIAAHTSKVGLEALVDSLCLAVTLRMIGCAQILLHPQEFEELGPKLTGKDPVPV